MSASTAMPSAILRPLDIRLLTLEHQVLGASALSLAEDGAEAGPSRQHASSLCRRIASIEDQLDRLGGNSDAIKRFLAGYPQYLPFLTHYDDGPNGPQSGTHAAASDVDDILPDATKATMLIAATPDIIVAERQLREVETLVKNGVEGSGDLETLLPLKEVLQSKVQEREGDAAALAQARGDVRELLRHYTDLTRTTSELFVDLHRRLEDLDEGVAKLERKRRRELAERF